MLLLLITNVNIIGVIGVVLNNNFIFRYYELAIKTAPKTKIITKKFLKAYEIIKISSL